ELAMSGCQHTAPELGFFRLLRLKGIKERFVLAGGIHPPLNTQLLQGANETEGSSGHTDGPNQARLVGIDLIGGTGNVIGPRSAQIGNYRVDLGLRILSAQPADLIVDIARLHRTAAWTIDTQDHRPGSR